MKPLASIKSGSNAPQSKYKIFTNPNFKSNVSESIIKTYKPDSSIKDSQKVNQYQAQPNSKTANLSNIIVSNQSPVVNLNINDECNNSEEIIDGKCAGKLIKFDLAQAMYNSKANSNTKSIHNSVIRKPYENSFSSNTSNVNNNRMKSIQSDYYTDSYLGKNIHSIIKNTTNQQNPNNHLEHTGKESNTASCYNTEIEIKNPNLKHTIYNSNINPYNSLNNGPVKLPSNQLDKFNECGENAESSKYQVNEPIKRSQRNIITHEIKLRKENLGANFDINKLKNFPKNVKSTRASDESYDDQSYNGNKFEINNQNNDDLIQNEEPYIKKKISKKIIQLNEGSKEEVFYEK